MSIEKPTCHKLRPDSWLKECPHPSILPNLGDRLVDLPYSRGDPETKSKRTVQETTSATYDIAYRRQRRLRWDPRLAPRRKRLRLPGREAPLHDSVSLCLCVSVSLCLCVSVSLCLCVYVSMCLCVCVSACRLPAWNIEVQTNTTPEAGIKDLVISTSYASSHPSPSQPLPPLPSHPLPAHPQPIPFPSRPLPQQRTPPGQWLPGGDAHAPAGRLLPGLAPPAAAWKELGQFLT